MARKKNGFRWTGEALADLKRWYATTENKELADILGCAVSTLTAKAGELHLYKDAEWLRNKRLDCWRMAMHAVRTKGNPGAFRIGGHPSPTTQFKKGNRLTPELEAKRVAGIRRYWLLKRDIRRTEALKKMGKPVRCESTGIEYPGIKAAARAFNIPSCQISSALTRGGLCHGLRFSYV